MTREFVHLGHNGCGMPWVEHTRFGNESVCPDQPGWIPPWTDDEEPEPPIASLFDTYEGD